MAMGSYWCSMRAFLSCSMWADVVAIALCTIIDNDDDDDEDDCKIINEYSCTPKWHVPWRNENFTYYGFEVIHGLKFSLQDFQLIRSVALSLWRSLLFCEKDSSTETGFKRPLRLHRAKKHATCVPWTDLSLLRLHPCFPGSSSSYYARHSG